MSSDAEFSAEELAFLNQKLPTLSDVIAGKFFAAGTWVEATQGHFLTLEGEDVGRLIYLASGRVEVTLRSRVVGYIDADSFVGEITALDGGPATATTMLLEPARYFVIAAPELKRLCFANPELRLALERAMALDTRRKLMAANDKLNEIGGV